MKKTMKYILMLSAFAMLTTGCRKNLDRVDDVYFDVSLDAETFKVGEPVLFHFSGNPDIIIFYSGEEGNDYAYKDTDRILESEMTFSFSTSTQSGTAGAPNPSRVPLCYSADFSGEYTEEAVRAATWVDITDRFTMPTDTDISGLLSGNVNVTEYFPDSETPLYFRFHYVVEAYDSAVDNGRTQWLISATKFNGIVGESISTLYDFVDMDWQFVLAASFDDAGTKPDNNGSRIRFRSEFKPPITRECWAVSGPIYRMDQINNGPDFGVGIKAMAETSLSSYSHIYTEPGDYEIVFVAANASVYGRKEVLRKVSVRIIEDEGKIMPPQPDEWNQ